MAAHKWWSLSRAHCDCEQPCSKRPWSSPSTTGSFVFLLSPSLTSLHWSAITFFPALFSLSSLRLLFSLHYCYVKITIFHPVVSKIKLRFYLKPVNREYPYSSVGMRAAAIIAMCRTLCPYSPAHKILGNRTTYFSTTHACFQISCKLARCGTNSWP